jgi:ubiquinone/menaquinone biosynthesis C-methylase UbiE
MERLPLLNGSGARTIAQKLSAISGGRVLDVCTGDGDFIWTLMRTLKDYESFVGVDWSKQGLKKAGKRFRRQPVQLLEMNAESLSFETDAFDTVCIAYSLHHLSKPAVVLAEMKRVLKPGGHFILKESYQDGDQTEAQITDMRKHHWKAKIDRAFGETHSETLTRAQIAALFRDLGLKQVTFIESSREVRCLFCPRRFDCENPRSKKLVDEYVKDIGNELKRLTPLSAAEALRVEGEQLKARARKTGVSDASILLAIGAK